MQVNEVARAMQDIEFVLFSVKNQDSLNKEEIEAAHEKAQILLKSYLQPVGLFE